jgi:hypothetical protein
MRTRIEVSPHKKYIPSNSAIKNKKPYQLLRLKNVKLLVATTIIT